MLNQVEKQNDLWWLVNSKLSTKKWRKKERKKCIKIYNFYGKFASRKQCSHARFEDCEDMHYIQVFCRLIKCPEKNFVENLWGIEFRSLNKKLCITPEFLVNLLLYFHRWWKCTTVFKLCLMLCQNEVFFNSLIYWT